MKHTIQILILLFFPVITIAQNDPITNNSRLFGIENVYSKVELMPEFENGETGLIEFYKKYSKFPITNNRSEADVVYYQIVIDEKGKVIKFKILKGQTDRLNQHTKDLISKMPKWKAGMQDGEYVKVSKILEIKYKKGTEIR